MRFFIPLMTVLFCNLAFSYNGPELTMKSDLSIRIPDNELYPQEEGKNSRLDKMKLVYHVLTNSDKVAISVHIVELITFATTLPVLGIYKGAKMLLPTPDRTNVATLNTKRIVLIHGTTGTVPTSLHWAFVREYLLLFPDVEVLEVGYESTKNIMTSVESVQAQIDAHFDTDKPVHLIGISQGALIAFKLAAMKKMSAPIASIFSLCGPLRGSPNLDGWNLKGALKDMAPNSEFIQQLKIDFTNHVAWEDIEIHVVESVNDPLVPPPHATPHDTAVFEWNLIQSNLGHFSPVINLQLWREIYEHIDD